MYKSKRAIIHWSRKKAGILAFLPRMDCFDYFDPRHGASRFPWSFKLLFPSALPEVSELHVAIRRGL
jgi:hypothetical protein